MCRHCSPATALNRHLPHGGQPQSLSVPLRGEREAESRPNVGGVFYQQPADKTRWCRGPYGESGRTCAAPPHQWRRSLYSEARPFVRQHAVHVPGGALGGSHPVSGSPLAGGDTAGFSGNAERDSRANRSARPAGRADRVRVGRPRPGSGSAALRGGPPGWRRTTSGPLPKTFCRGRILPAHCSSVVCTDPGVPFSSVLSGSPVTLFPSHSSHERCQYPQPLSTSSWRSVPSTTSGSPL